MSLAQAERSMNATFETSSSGASLQNWMPLWNLFQDRSKGTSGIRFLEEENGDPLVCENNGLEISFYDFNSTSADTPKLSLREETLRRLQRSHYLLLRSRFTEKLHVLNSREANWDGKQSQKPNPNAINRAFVTLDEFLAAVIDTGQVWQTPFLSSDEDGDITISWKNGKQELHIDISEETAEYIKVWGTNIEHEMYVGSLTPSEYTTLWNWLN